MDERQAAPQLVDPGWSYHWRNGGPMSLAGDIDFASSFGYLAP